MIVGHHGFEGGRCPIRLSTVPIFDGICRFEMHGSRVTATGLLGSSTPVVLPSSCTMAEGTGSAPSDSLGHLRTPPTASQARPVGVPSAVDFKPLVSGAFGTVVDTIRSIRRLTGDEKAPVEGHRPTTGCRRPLFPCRVPSRNRSNGFHPLGWGSDSRRPLVGARKRRRPTKKMRFCGRKMLFSAWNSVSPLKKDAFHAQKRSFQAATSAFRAQNRDWIIKNAFFDQKPRPLGSKSALPERQNPIPRRKKPFFNKNGRVEA